MNTQQCIKILCSMKTAKVAGNCAPQKPLMLLYVLGLIYHGHKNSFSFQELEAPVGNLFVEYGFRDRTQVSSTFWNMRNVDFWSLQDENGMSVDRQSSIPSKGRLRKMDLSGKLRDDIYDFLSSSQTAACFVSIEILERFVSTLDVDGIVAAIGLKNTFVLSILRDRLQKNIIALNESKLLAKKRIDKTRTIEKNRKHTHVSDTPLPAMDIRNSQEFSSYTKIDNFLKGIANLRIARVSGKYSPHKPLFLLYILGMISRGHSNKFTFKKIEKIFGNILEKYGFRHHIESRMPFWYLGNDEGIWFLRDKSGSLINTVNFCPTGDKLKEWDLYGSLDIDIYEHLLSHHDSLLKVIHKIIEMYLPDIDVVSLVEDIKLKKRLAKNIIASQKEQIPCNIGKKQVNAEMFRLLGKEINEGHKLTKLQEDQKCLENKLCESGFSTKKRLTEINLFSLQLNDSNAQEQSQNPKSENCLTIQEKNGIDFVQGKQRITLSTLEHIINNSLSMLPERERELILQYEGLMGPTRMPTLAELGRSLGISRERTRQLHNRALLHIKSELSLGAIDEFITNLIASIGGGAKINLYDLRSHIEKSNHFRKFNQLACVKMILAIGGYKKAISYGFLYYRNVATIKEIPVIEISEDDELIEWVYGIGDSESDLLNNRFDVIIDTRRLLSHSINSSTWDNLSKHQLFEYLWSSRMYSPLIERYNIVIEAVKDCGGVVSDEKVTAIMTRVFNTEGLKIVGLLKLLNEMGGNLAFDSKHFLWVADGYSWKDSSTFKTENKENDFTDLKDMSQSNAAHKILLEYGEPVTFVDITEIAIDRGYIKTRAKYPASGLRTLVYLEMQKDQELGRDSRFQILKGGYLGLTGQGRKLYEGDSRRSRVTKGRVSYTDLVYDILQHSGKPMHYSEIFDYLKNRGGDSLNINSTSKSIQNALKREERKDDSRFVEIEKGVWALSYFTHSKERASNSEKQKRLQDRNNKSESEEISEKRMFFDFLGLDNKD